MGWPPGAQRWLRTSRSGSNCERGRLPERKNHVSLLKTDGAARHQSTDQNSAVAAESAVRSAAITHHSLETQPTLSDLSTTAITGGYFAAWEETELFAEEIEPHSDYCAS
jgi:hypothetical protein